MINRLSRWLAAIRHDERGLALIEFAFGAPILLTLVLCGLEVANQALVNLRVNQIAMLVADNAARVRDSIDENDVNELLYGAKMTGNGIDFANHGRIQLYDVELNAAGTGQWIRWARCSGALNRPLTYSVDTGKSDNTLQTVGTGTNIVSATSGNPIMYVEVSYEYQPLVNVPFVTGKLFGGATKTITWRAAFNVRQRTNQTLYNANNVNVSSCSTYAA